MTRSTPIATAMLASLLAASLPAAPRQPVPVTGGLVSGVPGSDPDILAFKGIPFAAPPTGDLRWRPPAPVAAWQGVRRADRFSPSCMQHLVPERKPWTAEFMTHGEVSEDCLYLNVWTAAKSNSAKRPVFVYLHGGGFGEGSAAIAVYDGEGLARKGLVVVTLNYRLGVLGFLVHPELTRESGRNASGNYGLLDQIAALQWIQANIARFGGDPNRVTIAGQSAGGMAVHELIASPLARGLFHRAIVQSGGSALGRGGITLNSPGLADAEEIGQRFAQGRGAKSIAELRAMSWEQLAGTGDAPPGGTAATGTTAPVIDGYVLPAPVREVVRQGKQNDVPTLTGVNLGELGAFPPSPAPVTLESFRSQSRRQYGDEADRFLALYPASNDQDAAAAQTHSSRDRALVSLCLWARERSRTARTKAFQYLWDHALPGPDAATYGAFHTAEVPYVLNTLYRSDRPFTDADRKIAAMMSSYWANFAANGDPNGKGLAVWPACSDKAEIMELGDRNGPVPAAPSPAKFAFFEAILTRQ